MGSKSAKVMICAWILLAAAACKDESPQHDPCEGVDCGHGTCVVIGGSATCDCDPGYRAEGLSCVPVEADGEAEPDAPPDGEDVGREEAVDAEVDILPETEDGAEGLEDVTGEDVEEAGDELDITEMEDAFDGMDAEDLSLEPDSTDAADTPDEPDAPDAADDPELPPGLVWVSIPAGSFEMGCSPGDDDCDYEETPRHTVNVPAFEMTETEITQDQYEWVTGSNPSYYTACGGNCPIETVAWDEAKAFCRAIGGRLPSEAEWEYAARGGTTTRYYCGDDPACLDAVAWYDVNAGMTTHPVGEKTANDFGLYDVLGNVMEWVEDCWHDDYTGAPDDGSVWSGGDCDSSALRGGSWPSHYDNMRVSFRFEHYTGTHQNYIGFRCAR